MKEEIKCYKYSTFILLFLSVIVCGYYFVYDKDVFDLNPLIIFGWIIAAFFLVSFFCIALYHWVSRTNDLSALNEILKNKHKAQRDKATELNYQSNETVTYIANDGTLQSYPNKRVYTENYIEYVTIGKTSYPQPRSREVTEYKFDIIVKTQSGKKYGFTDGAFLDKEKDFYILASDKKSKVFGNCDLKNVFVPFHDDYFRCGEECIKLV